MGIFAATIPPALGVAVSPFPTVGLILVLLSRKARVNSLCYLGGWMAGTLIAFFFSYGTISALPEREETLFSLIIQLAIGLACLAGAATRLGGVARKLPEPPPPKWFEKLSDIGPGGALLLSLGLSMLNPKDTLLAVKAGVATAATTASLAEAAAVGVMFAVIASCVIITLVCVFQAAGQRVVPFLHDTKAWLLRYNRLIMGIFLFIVGCRFTAGAVRSLFS